MKNHGFTPVSREAAEEYERKKLDLTSAVNAAMLSRANLEELVGAGGREAMLDNHMNHSAFISLVLRLNRFDALHATLPWVYRAYINRGFSPAYFPAELAAWMNAITEKMTAESALEIQPVYRRMASLHEDSLQRSVAAKSPDRLAGVPPEWRNLSESFRNSLIPGNITACQEITRQAVESGGSPVDFLLYVVQPALYRIGDLWESGRVTVAEEHRATAIALRVISTLAGGAPSKGRDKGRAMVLAVKGERHEVGAAMVADCLEGDGWETVFLGSDLPEIDIITHLASFKPHLVALSATIPQSISSLSHLVGVIKRSETFGDISVMVGGLAFSLFDGLGGEIGADAFAQDCREAVVEARRLWHGKSSRR